MVEKAKPLQYTTNDRGNPLRHTFLPWKSFVKLFFSTIFPTIPFRKKEWIRWAGLTRRSQLKTRKWSHHLHVRVRAPLSGTSLTIYVGEINFVKKKTAFHVSMRQTFQRLKLFLCDYIIEIICQFISIICYLGVEKKWL